MLKLLILIDLRKTSSPTSPGIPLDWEGLRRPGGPGNQILSDFLVTGVDGNPSLASASHANLQTEEDRQKKTEEGKNKKGIKGKGRPEGRPFLFLPSIL